MRAPGLCGALLALVLGLKALDSASMIFLILKLAGYTYGPLLGLFDFALFTPRAVSARALAAVCMAAPLVCGLIDLGQPYAGYGIGLVLLLNGLLTCVGLWCAGCQRG